MRKLLLGLAVIAAVAGTTLGVATGSADAATAPGTTTIWVGLGSGHLYNGTYDACTGTFNATGKTTGATGVYDETVTGKYDKATGNLSFTSVYGLDANGVIDDSTGVNNSTYAYTLTGNVAADNWATGSITVTKTPVDTGVPVTNDFGSFGGQSVWFEAAGDGSTCPVPPVLDGDNHGKCVSSASHAGIKGTALAKIAKDVTRTGAYGISPSCPKIA
jgi:hypothetical protein